MHQYHKSITLTDLETVDNSETKIGFWLGEIRIAENESWNLMEPSKQPPIESGNNAFNGTIVLQTATSSTISTLIITALKGLLTRRSLSNNRNNLKSGLILLNNIVTVLNTELPDAPLPLDNIERPTVCRDSSFTINIRSTILRVPDRLPPVSIGFFADNNLATTTQTSNF